jgi:hydrogenase-4 component F
MMVLNLLLIPLAAAASISLSHRRALMELLHTGAAIAVFGIGVAVAAEVLDGEILVAGTNLLRVDSLSALMVVIITFLGAVAAFYAIGYLRAEFADADLPRARLFFSLFHLFIFTMLLAATTDNHGVMWVSIEGTTLATVFLVNLRRSRTSLEAAYKYLILSSVGIALAFIGTALVYYAGAAKAGEIAVNWSALSAAASLNPEVMRLAFVFILIGYGTKAGLAPMHTWLPDAHSEAPAPISALMSGVLLNVGLYAVLRFKAVVDLNIGSHFTGALLLGIGLLSLAVAAAFLVRPRNYKRMLAYSSVEHMGIICLGLGFGGYWGTFGALFHILNHALSKSLLFMLSGNILRKYHSAAIDDVRGVLHTAPWTGALFLAGTFALLGFPPFAPFVSEFIIFRAGLDTHPWVAALGVILLVVVFAGMLASINRMLYGLAPADLPRGDGLRLWLAPLTLNLALLLVLGLTLPLPLQAALNKVLQVLGI